MSLLFELFLQVQVSPHALAPHQVYSRFVFHLFLDQHHPLKSKVECISFYGVLHPLIFAIFYTFHVSNSDNVSFDLLTDVFCKIIESFLYF